VLGLDLESQKNIQERINHLNENFCIERNVIVKLHLVNMMLKVTQHSNK